jgi:hypothetical protein
MVKPEIIHSLETRVNKDGVDSLIKENYMDGPKGLTFSLLHKTKDDFYRLSGKEKEPGHFDVKEKKGEKEEVLTLDTKSLLGHVKSDKRLVFLVSYLKTRQVPAKLQSRAKKAGSKKSSSKKSSSKKVSSKKSGSKKVGSKKASSKKVGSKKASSKKASSKKVGSKKSKSSSMMMPLVGGKKSKKSSTKKVGSKKTKASVSKKAKTKTSRKTKTSKKSKSKSKSKSKAQA